jgi:hypothetical protein
VSGQLHAPAALPPGKEPPGTHWIRGWVDPRAGLDDVEKRKFLTLPGPLDLSAVQPVASRYTDYAVPAQISTYLSTDIILTTIVSDQLVAMKAYIFTHLIFYTNIWLPIMAPLSLSSSVSINVITYLHI